MGEQKEKRFRFEKDDSGHYYIIPADKNREFEKWLETNQDEEEWAGTPFDDYRCDRHPSCYTFCDPQEDK